MIRKGTIQNIMDKEVQDDIDVFAMEYDTMTKVHDVSDDESVMSILKNGGGGSTNATLLSFALVLLAISLLMIGYVGLGFSLNALNDNRAMFPYVVNKVSQFHNLHYPLLLDVPGNGGSEMSRVLSECVGMRSSPIQRLNNDKFQEKSLAKVDFFVTNSLCKLHSVNKQDFTFELYALVQNPIVRLFETYQKVNNGRNKGSFVDFLKNDRAKSDFNAVSKSVLCNKKNLDDVTEKEFQQVIHFLKKRSHVSVFSSYEDAIRKIKERYYWGMEDFDDSKFLDCMKTKFSDTTSKRVLSDVKDYDKVVEQIYASDSYDMRLYMEFFGKNHGNKSNRTIFAL